MAKLYSLDCNINSIIEQQHYLSKYVNISFGESEFMFDHEREAHWALLIRDKREELNQAQNPQGQSGISKGQ